MCPKLFIDIHTHQSKQADDILFILNCFAEQKKFENDPEKWISIGLHPWHVNTDNGLFIIEQIKTIASYSNVLAIGEVGLDRTIETSLDVQEKYFIKQIRIAEKLNKPLIIHCVKCFSELLSIKKKLNSTTPWIIHGFRNNNQIALKLLKQNCYLSFGKALLFDKNNQILFIETSLNKIFLETDESKYSINDIYNKAAQLKNLQLNKLKEIIMNNYKTVF